MDNDYDIVESWIDHHGTCYAIVRNSERFQKTYDCKPFEPMWVDDPDSSSPELWPFGGSVGYISPYFDTVDEARDFLLKGISEVDNNPEAWLEMVAAR